MTVEVCTSVVLDDAEGCEYDADVILIVSVDHHAVVKGSYSYNAPSDMDYHGYEEMEYTVKEVWIDDGKFDKPVPFTQELFNKPQYIDQIETAIRESYED